MTVPMALMDFVPVLFFGALLLHRAGLADRDALNKGA